MNWINIVSSDQLDEIRKKSFEKPQAIFKHSTRCAISAMAKGRLERTEAPANIDFYYLDLIKYKLLSSQLAEEFDVWHESPQVLLIKNGKCIYDESHTAIRMEDIVSVSSK